MKKTLKTATLGTNLTNLIEHPLLSRFSVSAVS